LLAAGLAADLQRFQSAPADARQLINQGSSQPNPQLPPETLAAWTLTAATLLNLDEVLVH
jgi:hypothetical protein